MPKSVVNKWADQKKKGKQRARKEVHFGRGFCPPSLFESESADFRAALPVRRKFDVYGCDGFC